MSTPLTFDEFRRANVARCIKWHPAGIASWSPSDWLTAVTGELGELASLLKMRNRERDGLPGNKFSPSDKQVADEIADVLTYLDLLAEVLGVDLGRAAVSKFNEISERVGFPDRLSETQRSQESDRRALVERMRAAIGFFMSAVKCGEDWTPRCEEVRKDALAAIEALAGMNANALEHLTKHPGDTAACLPDWSDISEKPEAQHTALERFIYNNEPAGRIDSPRWREGLAAALAETQGPSHAERQED